MDISFVYFDLGQVLVSNKLGWDEFVNRMKFSKEEELMYWRAWSEVSGRVCDNSLSPGQAKTVIEERMGRSLGDDFDLVGGVVAMYEAVKPAQELLIKLQKVLKVGLLSNAYPGMIQLLMRERKLPIVYYNVIVDSSEVEVLKPDEKIFRIATQRAGVNPKEIFYVDDNSEFVDVAQQLGWNGYLFSEDEVDRGVAEISSALLK